MSFIDIVNTAKDRVIVNIKQRAVRVIEAGLKPFINQYIIKPYGHMNKLEIDTTAKTIHVELNLKGETAPLLIDVKSYELTSEAGETHIKLGDVVTSREWINQLIGSYLPPEKKSFKVPAGVKVIL